MDHYEDGHLVVRTAGEWGSAREAAGQIIDHNIQGGVERLASGIDADAITENLRVQRARLLAEMAEAAKLRAARARAADLERALAREHVREPVRGIRFS